MAGAQTGARGTTGADGGANIVIDTSDKTQVWVTASDSSDNTVPDPRPVDKQGSELFLYILTVQNDDGTKNIAGAQVEVPVGSYTYHTVTDENGKAQLWLPIARYTLSGDNVSHENYGSILPGQELRVDLRDEVDGKTGTVRIGRSLELSLSTDAKTYTDGVDKPVTVYADTSMLTNAVINRVSWFAEPTSSGNLYAGVASGSSLAFSTGYANAGANNKGETTTQTAGVYNFPINQNGRYWVQVEFTKDGVASKQVASIEVTNIYRKFAIQVNSYTDENGKKVGQTGYGPLKNADDSEYTENYGFAWDLDGYNANNLDGTKLLAEDVAPYDTVPIVPKSASAAWYTAKLAGNNEIFNVDGDKGYEPITLTLNPDFLSADKNERCDTNDTGVKDVSKYTIVYTIRGGVLTTVNVTGMDEAATDGSTLYSNPRSYLEMINEDTLTAQKLRGYKLVGVKVILADGTETNGTLTAQPDGSQAVAITGIQGTAAKNYQDRIAEVRFIYADNMTNVTIKAYYTDQTTPVEGFVQYKVPMEVGTKVTYDAPVIDGFVNDGNSMTDGSYTVVENGSISFYYYKQTGNVFYRAVLKGTENVIWQKGGKVQKGSAPDTNVLPDAVTDADLLLMYKREGSDVKITDSTGAVVASYDGIHDLTVTYTFVRQTRDVTVNQIDVDSAATLGTETETGKNVGEYIVINAPATPANYELVGESSKAIYVAPTDDLVVNFYYRTSEKATITIKLYASAEDKDSDTPFNTMTVTGFYGAKQTIYAPTIIGWELADNEPQSIDLTPVKDNQDSMVAKFVYKAVYDEITVNYREKDVTGGTGDLGSQTYQVQRGQGLSVVAPYVKGYKLSDTGLDGQAQAAAWNPSAEDLKTTQTHTFYYSKIGADDLVKINVSGVDAEGTQLYSYQKLVPVGGADEKIAAFAQPKLTLDKATVGGVGTAVSEAKEVTVSLAGKNANDEINVVFTYKSNMAKVIINAKLNSDKVTEVPGFQAIEVHAEIGDILTYTAPAIENYVYVGRTHESGLKVTGNPDTDVIDFYYEAAAVKGNVTYVAVDKDNVNTILAYGPSALLIKGELVDVDTNAGIQKFFPAGVTNWEWTGEAPIVAGADEGKYDGQNNITVTFKFQRGTKSIGIKLMDADTGEEITVAGQTFSKIVSKGVETTIDAPEVAGYTAIPNQSVKVTAADNNEAESVTFFYRKNDNSASVTVELWYVDPADSTEKRFNSYTVPGVLGTTRTVTAPDLSGQGFTDPDKTEEQVTFTANTAKVKFVYRTVEHKTVTVELKSDTDDITSQVPGLKTSYVLRKGEGLTLNAPSIYGYALADNQAQVISKTYDDLTDNEVITINYKKVEVDFINITVIGKVEGAANNLYSYVTSVGVDVGTAELNVYDWPQYKVKDGQAVVTGEKTETINVQDGKAIVSFDENVRSLTVTVTYVKNTANVTVKAYMFVDGQQTTEPVNGFNEITFEGVIGEDVSYTAPSLPGYALKGNNLVDGKLTVSEDAAQNTIIFYYAKNEGMVTYRAVDDQGKDLGYSVSETLTADTAVDNSQAKAPAVPNYRVKSTEGTISGATADNKFDGKNPVTVTYVYEKFTKSVKIILMDDATHKEITRVDSEAYEAGSMAAIPAPDISAIAEMKGYKLVSAPTQNRFILDNDNEQFVTFYYSVEESSRPHVTVNLKDENGALIHSYTVTGDWDLPMTIAVPDLKSQGYEYANANETTVTVTPEKDDPDSLVKDLTYKILYRTITVIIDPTEASNLLPEQDYARTYQVKHNSAFTLTAPSIAGYTLVSGNLNKVWSNVTANETVTFQYQASSEVTNSVHTIVGETDQGVQLYKFTQTVIKDGNSTTYTATPIDGYSVNEQTQTLKNSENGTVTFIYTNKAATVTVVPVDENGVEIPDASVTYTGYEKGQKGVVIRAVHVADKVLIGPYVDGKVNGNGLTQTVDLSETVVDNVVKFAYRTRVAKWTFILNCADDNVVIRVIEGAEGLYSVAAGGKLDLTAEGFDFDADNAGNSEEFKGKADGSVTIAADSVSSTYNLYYTHQKQSIEYAYELTDGTPIELGNAVNPNPAEYKVNEELVVVAPQIPGYTPVDMRQSVTVTKQADGQAQKITFQYTKKATGTITVEHKVAGETAAFSSYTVTVSDGEWFTANALTDAKYTLVGDAEQSIQASSNQHKTITFEYNKNFVVVNTFTNIGNGDHPFESGIEVVKGQNVELTPPARSGYVLKGIKVVGAATVGGENDLNVAGYVNDKLTLTALTEDTQVYYYYKPISDAVTENQVEITVIEKYEVFELGSKTYKETKLTTDTTKQYAFNEYKGFKLTGYEVDGVARQIAENFTGASVDLKSNHTITYIYGLIDGGNNVVVPGKDNKLPSDDDVTIKPTDPDKKPDVDDKGTVTVPDGGGKVETPDGTVEVPGDSTVDKDGTIKDPDGNVIDPANPGEIKDHCFVQYKANGGVGESYTHYFKTDASVTLKDVGELFIRENYTADGWNTYANGKGVTYAEGDKFEGASITLYAQWKESEQPTGRYTATIILKPNGAQGADVNQIIASNDNNPIRENIKANPFKVDEWTFKGWLTSENSGTYYADQAVAEVKNGETLPLYAQWIRENADGSITVPGGDNKPNTADDVTAKPNPNPEPGKDGSLKRDETTGVITVPEGGSAVNKDGEIDMPNGGAVKPDGTIIVKDPNGDITIDPDGNVSTEDGKTVYCLTYHSGVADVKNVKVYFTTSVKVSADVMTREGHVLACWLRDDNKTIAKIGEEITEDTELTAKWYQVGEDGSVTVPGEKGDVVVKPDPDTDEKPTVNPDTGEVDIPGTGPVETPDGPVVVPGGSKVEPDGSIKDGDGNTLYPTDPGKDTPDGYFKVVYKPGDTDVAGQKNVTQLVKIGDNAVVMGNPFASAQKVFIGWKDEETGKVVEFTTELSDTTVLVAQWKLAGSVTLEWAKDSKVQDGAVAGEYKLIMRGLWATTDSDNSEKSYTIPVLVDGKAAVTGDLRWYVDAASYKTEFGFTGNLTGDDIVSVNAQTGEITVKNSGIVRIWCESTADPSIRISVVVIAAGDITKDGRVAMSDINYLYALVDEDIELPEVKADDHTTWYLKELADLSNNDAVDMSDINALWSLVEEDTSI